MKLFNLAVCFANHPIICIDKEAGKKACVIE